MPNNQCYEEVREINNKNHNYCAHTLGQLSIGAVAYCNALRKPPEHISVYKTFLLLVIW